MRDTFSLALALNLHYISIHYILSLAASSGMSYSFSGKKKGSWHYKCHLASYKKKRDTARVFERLKSEISPCEAANIRNNVYLIIPFSF